jgi:anion-transporting  ArsA/GET3 family ATPase
MSLAPLLDRHRVLVCVGSGGVGKTTVSAALALAAAQRGRRTLCLTIDPARRLANSLGLERMPTEQVEVSREWLAEHGVALSGSLTVMMLDTKQTFDELVRRYAPSDEVRERILENRLYRHVSTSLAGTQSYMAMEKVLMVEQDPSYDTIVLDTPPMQHALDFFEAPERMVEAIDSPALRGLVQAIQSSGRFSLNLVAKNIGAVLRTIGRITGGDLLHQMAEFVSSMNALFGGFHERAELVSREMRSSRFGYIAVSSPAKLTLSEAAALDDRMRERGLRTSALVINRVHPALGALPSRDEVQALLDAQDVKLASGGAQRVLQAAREESALAAREVGELDALSVRLGAQRIPVQIRVPAFAVDVHHPERLEQVARHLCGEA